MLFRGARIWLLVALCCFGAWGQAPASLESSIREAIQQAASGNLQRAEQMLLELEKAHPEQPEVLYRLGVILLRQQKTEAAGERLEKAARLAPGSPLVWLGAAQTRLQLGRREEAIEAAERALSLAPEEPGVARALAMFYSQAGEFGKAADQELRWSRTASQPQQSQARAAELYLRAGNADKAIELAEQVLAAGDDPEVRRLLGLAYREKGDPAKAVEHLQRSIRLNPESPAGYLDLAQLFIDHRTPQPAVLILQEGLRRLPNQPELVRMLGLAYYGTGDMSKALDAFLQLTQMEPDSEVAYSSLETLLPEAGDRMPEVLERLRGFSKRNPASPIGHFLQARALQLQSPEKKDEIRVLLERAIAAAPTFWPAHFELHKLLLEAGEVKEAAAALEKTVELNPDYAPAHYALAQIYARLGDRERARTEREVHHALATREREAAEQRREEAPRLPYTILEPAEQPPSQN